MTIVIFAYRWWALNGIGGYTAPGGEANILHFNIVRTIDALLLRQWAVLLFPFNWTIPSGPILRGRWHLLLSSHDSRLAHIATM